MSFTKDNKPNGIGDFTPEGVFIGAYIRLGTRVSYIDHVGIISSHDHAWNNCVSFDEYQDVWPRKTWARANHMTLADGSPLGPEHLTTVRGTGYNV